MTELSAEDQKLVTLARATRARTGARRGRRGPRHRRPDLRRGDGRPCRRSRSPRSACASPWRSSSGSRGLEAAVLLTDGRRCSPLDLEVLRDFGGDGVAVHVGDPRRNRSTTLDTTGRGELAVRPIDGDLANLQRTAGVGCSGDPGAWEQHERAVERLRASYAAIPAGAPVRLAKKTSNLFRPRAATERARARRLRARRGDRGRRRAPDRRRAGHVHLRAPGRRDAAARADPAGGAAAAHDHPRRRGDRARASSRPASATGCRTSRCSRWTCSPAPARSSPPGRATTCSTRSRTPTARSATPPG